METDCECAFEEEEHDRCADAASICNTCFVLDVVDKACLHDHNRAHDRDTGEEERPSSDPIDEEPRDEGRDEKPCLQEPRHQCRQVIREAERGAEKSVGVIDQSVYAPELLERLNCACDQEASLRLDVVVSQQVFPGASTEGFFVFKSLEDGGVKGRDFFAGAVIFVEAG